MKMQTVHPQSVTPSLLVYNKIITQVRRLLHVLDMDFLNPEYRVGRSVIFVNVHIFIFFSLSMYTILQTWREPVEMLKCVCTFGIPIRLAFMTNRMSGERDNIIAINEHILWMHRNAHGQYQKVLFEWTDFSYRILGFQAAIYLLATHMVLLFPIFCYAFFREKVLVLTLLVPGMDLEAWPGFISFSLFEVNCTYISMFVLMPADMYFVLICLMTCAHIELVRVRCQQFGQITVDWEAKSRLPMSVTKMRRHRRRIFEELLTCIIAGKKADQMLDMICKCFEDICGVQLAVAGVALALCVLAGRVTTWPMAFPLGFTFLFVMCLNAILGTLIERQGDKMAQAVYEIPWYLLPVSEQKMLQFMLMNWQKIRCVSVFGSSNLNVATVQAILKTIYSGYMMLDSTL